MIKKFSILICSLSLFVLAISCGGDKAAAPSSDKSESPEEPTTSTEEEVAAEEKPSNRRGQLIYKQYCIICHGADGKLAVSGAKDLSISTISLEERINQVTNGKGLMTPYKDILSEEQIFAVATYLEELRQ